MKRQVQHPLWAALLVLAAGPLAAADWEEITTSSAPSARFGHSMVTVGTDIYLFGGTDGGFPSPAVSGELFKWDRASQGWIEQGASNPPPARYYHGAATANGKLYVGYGFGPTGLLGDLWQYDPQTNAWVQFNVLNGPEPNYLGGMVGLGNNQILVAGGYDVGGELIVEAYIIDLPATKTLTVPAHPIMSLPGGLYGFSLASTGSSLPLIIGGWDEHGPTGEIIRWDPDPAPLGQWTSVVPLGSAVLARALAASAHYRGPSKARWGDAIIILGGESEDKATATDDTQIYDIVNNTWSYGPDMLLGLSSFAAAVLPPESGSTPVTMEILTFGGRNNSGDPIGWTFKLTTDIVVDPTETETSFITASAHGAGVGGTMWLTDLEAHNRGSDAAECTLSLLVARQGNPSPATATFSVPAGQSVRYSDLLDTLFAFEGSAALRLEVTGGDLIATSRTFNQGATGTYGQFIPAVAADEALSDADEARLIQLSYSQDDSAGFRTNIGFVNATDSAIDVEIELYDHTAVLSGTVSRSLEPFEFRQLTDVYSGVATGDVDDGFAVVRSTTAGARYFVYASVVDNVTGDPTYVVPVDPMGTAGGIITAAAHSPGANQTVWRSTVEIYASGTGPAVPCTIELLEKNQDNTAPLSEQITVPAGESVRLEDVLDTQFGFEGSAALRFTSPADSLMITSRTFNQGAEGTYGQYIPLAPLGAAVAYGEQARLIQLSDSVSSATGFRTNVGFVSATATAISIDAVLYDAAGVLLGTVTTDMEPFGYRQVNDIFSKVTTSDVADGFAIVSTSTEGGHFFCYASVVDNLTGDPVYIPGM